MKLLLTKHGNVLEREKVKNLILGTIPGSLSSKGKIQANKLAKRLQNEKIDAIYSSDLGRSADTAKIIASYHPNTPLYFTMDLRERNLGDVQGKDSQVIGWNQNNPQFICPPNGENLEKLSLRIKKFLNKITDKHQSETVLLVAHCDTNRAIVSYITKNTPESILTIEPQPECSLSIFEIDDKKNCKTILFNNTDHLSIK